MTDPKRERPTSITENSDTEKKPSDVASQGYRRGARLMIIVAGLLAWFGTQALIGIRTDSEDRIVDALLEWTIPINEFLHENPRLADALLISSSAIVDILGIFLLGQALFGSSLRPFITLMIVFLARQTCVVLVALPLPKRVIWHHPGFPSLLVTYGTSTDLFFSGHTGIAVIGSLELAQTGSLLAKIIGAFTVIYEIATIIVLHAHYTMDIFTGVTTALLAPTIVDWMYSRSESSRDSHYKAA